MESTSCLLCSASRVGRRALAVLCLSSLILHPSSYAQQTDRQTKLILPKMVPGLRVWHDF